MVKNIFLTLVMLLTNLWVWPVEATAKAVVTKEKLDRIYVLLNRPVVGNRALSEKQFLSIPSIVSEINYRKIDGIFKNGLEYKIKQGNRDDNIFAIRAIKIDGKILGVAEYVGHIGPIQFGAISDPMGEMFYNLGDDFEIVTENRQISVTKHKFKKYYIVAGYLSCYPGAFFIANISSDIWDKNF